MTRVGLNDLAGRVAALRPVDFETNTLAAHCVLWREMRDMLGKYLAERNPRFDLDRWQHATTAIVQLPPKCGVEGCDCHQQRTIPIRVVGR